MLENLHIEQYGVLRTKASDIISSSDASPYTYIVLDREFKRVLVDQLWFWTKEWQSGENRVDEYIQEGNVQEYDSMEEFLESLRD